MRMRTVKFPPPIKGESPVKSAEVGDTANKVINFDIEDGTLVPRAAIGAPVYSGVEVSGMCAFGPALFICDSGTLYKLHRDAVQRVGEVGVGSTLDSVLWNDWLWFVTVSGLYRVGASLDPELIYHPAPFVSSSGGDGELLNVAVTALNRGFESSPAMLQVNEGATLVVDADFARVYTEVGGVYYHTTDVTRDSSAVVRKGSGDICQVIGRNPMPGGVFITAFGGRVAVAEGPILYISDPFMPHLYNAAYGAVEFTGAIAFVEALSSNALVIGDYNGVWVLRLSEDGRAELKRVADTPPVWGSAIRVPAEGLLNGTPTNHEAVLFLTRRGWLVVFYDGSVTEVPQDVGVHKARTALLRSSTGWRVVACAGG